jgi:Zn-dependent protease
MFHSWKIGTAFGIGIYVHWSFLILPAFVFFERLGLGGLELALIAVGLVLAVFGCIVLHELGHALAARRFGIRTRDITLYPIGGVARLERMSEKPWEEFWIAVAGPAVNVAIAAVLWVGLLALGGVAHALPLPGDGLMFLFMLMIINLFLAGFNMLPAFPMDGGRVLRALLATRLGHLRATEAAVGIGTFMAILMAVVGAVVFQSLSLVLVAGFVWLMGQGELAGAYQRERRKEPRPFGFEPEYDDRPSSPMPPPMRVFLWDPERQIWVRQGPPLGSRRI